MATKSDTPIESASTNGKLPEGWRMVQFGDVVRDVKESERNPLEAGLDRYIGLEHIEPESLHITEWGDLTQDEVSFTKRFRKGQVLFAKRRAYQRKVGLAEFDGICSSDILTFEPKDDSLIPELLPFIVQSDAFFDHALDTSSGSLSPRTRWSQLKDFEFSLPPIPEQRRIADILSATNEVFQQRQGVVKHLRQLHRSILADELSGAIGHSSVKQFQMSQVRDGWQISTISDIARVIRGSSPRPKGDPRYYGGNVPRLMVADITRDGKYVTPTIDFLTEEGAEKSRPVPAGTFVLVCSGTKEAVGLPGLLAVDACIHDGIIALTEISDSCEPEWLFYMFTFFQTFLDAAATHGGTFVNLTTDIVRGVQVALPPLDFQVSFIKRMRLLDECIRSTMNQVEEDAQLLKAIGNQVLAGNPL